MLESSRARTMLTWPALLAALLASGAADADKPLIDPLAEARVRVSAFEAAKSLRADAERSRLMRSAALARLRALTAQNPIDIVHTDIKVAPDVPSQTVAATITLRIAALEEGVSEALFTFVPAGEPAVDDGQGNPLDFVLDADYGMISVALPAPLAAGEETTVRFSMQGAPDCSPDPYFGMAFCAMEANFVFFITPMWVPMKAAYDYKDFYTSGKVDLDVVTRPGNVTVSTSDYVNRESTSEGMVHHFKGRFAADGVSFAYGPFDIFESETKDGKPVKAYIHTGTTAYGQKWADIAADIIDLFSARFSPYLYDKQDVVQTGDELGIGGAVGPQSATFYYAGALNADPAGVMSESVFSHEIGHSWWGNMIRNGDTWSPWLSEGFAEYSSRLYGYEVWPARNQNYLYEYYFRYFALTVPPGNEVPITGEKIYTDDLNLYSLLTYDKGAHVVRMLEWLLGDEVFFAGLSKLAEDYGWEKTRAVMDVPALAAELKQMSGLDLAPFFDQWVYGTGYPVYRFAAEFGGEGEKSTARVRIEQIQDSDTVYDLPIEVEVWVGEEEEPRRFRVEFDGRIADATLALDAPPRALKVDKAAWIWGDKLPALAGDVDGSNEVDGLDFVYAAWAMGGDFTSETAYNYYGDADFNRDGKTDADDMAEVTKNFGEKGTIND
ncbi:MAG: M1 family aminopeptidase [Deltaproteobacteria bacterium]|nr:M1 family aminopeptidase [Deltaproteobacteria bacterium]